MQKFLRTLMLVAVMLLPFASHAQTCEPISTFPVTYGFEESEGFATTVTGAAACTTNVFNSCWRNEATTSVGSYGTRIWHIYGGTTASQIHSGAHSLILPDKGSSSAGVSTTMLTFPAMSFTSAGGYVVSFWIYRSGTSSNPEGFKMYVSNTDTIDANAVELGHYSRNRSIAYPVVESTSGWYQYETAPITLTGTVYLIFEGQSYYGSSTYVDDIVISEAPSCFKVTNLAIDAVTDNSITLSWTDALNTGATYTIYDMSDTSVVASGVTGTTYTATGLTSNTAYSFAVMTDCGAGDVTDLTAPVNGRTACVAMALPWTCGFEAEEIQSTTQATALPWCSDRWVYPATVSYPNYPYSYSSSTYAYNGSSRCLYFYGTTGTSYPEVMAFILPAVDVTTYPMNGNRISFWARMSSTSYDKYVYVATVDDPSQMGTHVIVDSVLVTGTTYTKYTVPLTTAVTNHQYVVLLVNRGSGSLYMDDMTLEEAPSCLEVVSVSVGNVTSNSIDLSWVPNAGNASATYSVYDMSDTSLVATGLTSTTYTVTGLTANTQYTFGVQANCAAGDAPFTTVSVNTACVAIDLPYTETFEATSGTRSCWNFVSMNTGNDLGTSNGMGFYTISGRETWRFSSYSNHGGSNDYNQYGYSPVMDATGLTADSLHVKVVYATYNSSNKLYFGYITATDTVWNPAEFTTTGSSDFQTLEANLPLNATQLAVRYYGNYSYYAWIDTVEVTGYIIPSCPAVTGLAASNITESGVTLSWTGDADSYTIVDMADPSVALFTVTETTVAPAALAPMTQYTYGIIANCGTNHSDTVTVTFSTACSSISLPFTETFEATSGTVGCWSTDGPGNWTIGTGDYSSTTGAFEGSLNAKITHGTTGDVTKLISPVLSGVTNGLQLTFAHIQRSWAGDIDNLAVYYRASSDAAWQQVVSYTDAVAAWTVESVTIPGTIYQVAFEYTDHYGYGVGIDSIVFDEAPACLPVIGLTLDSQTATSANVHWVSTGATGYEVEVRQNEVPLTTVSVVIADTTAVISGLAIDNDYQIVVRSVCGSDYSPWSSALNVHIGYCVPNPTSRDAQGITGVAFGGMTNTASHPSAAPYYGNYSAMAGTVPAGLTASVDITFATGYTYGTIIWVDWNNSLSFDADEVVYRGTSESTNPTTLTATFDIPATQAVGDYRMRIATADSYFDSYVSDPTSTPDPCFTASYAVAEDYTLTVSAAPACMPAVVTVDAATENSVTISWTGTAASYDVYNGTILVANVTTNTYTFTGLTAATAYLFGVQAICSATDTAVMNTVMAYTACSAAAINLPFNETFNATSGTRNCWTSVDGDNDGFGWSTMYAGADQEMMLSFSYDNDEEEPLTPSNWLISPKLHTSAGSTVTMNWIAAAASSNWAAEHYGVYVSTTTADTTAFTMLQEWTLSAADANGTLNTIDLSAYAGQDIYVAFHHFNCTDQVALIIEDVNVYEGAFVPDTLTVTFAVNDATMGTTIPAPGTYQYITGDTVTFQALANPGYHFVGFVKTAAGVNDTTLDDSYVSFYFPAAVMMDYDSLTLTALFEAGNPDSMQVTIAVNDPTMGTTIPAPGVHYYYADQPASLIAVPNTGNHLEGWVYQITIPGYGSQTDTIPLAVPDFFEAMLDGDPLPAMWCQYELTVTALFAAGEPIEMHDSVIVTTAVNDPAMGSITPAPGTHYYVEGDTAILCITPNPGYYIYAIQLTESHPMFGTFNETITDPEEIAEFMLPDTMIVSVDDYGMMIDINVLFAPEGTVPNSYHVTVNYDVTRGTVTGGDEDYIEGSTVTLTAMAFNGYQFLAWVENGDTVGRHTVYTIDNIDADHTLTAVFVTATQGIEDVDMENVSIYSTDNVIVVSGAEGKDVVLFDVNGRMLSREASAAERVEFRVNNSGVYLVKVANAAAKRVVVIR